ncbi:hypothetical protein ACEN2J_11180 [Pseudorhodobacter sp. W20_MBD10_FR17]|uniref:hypothetical protein n=1 Tax=Pseudorhodobacter sp. W20_MBD10_FR17 TaxID=3240266 RepID=UPI003F968CD1
MLRAVLTFSLLALLQGCAGFPDVDVVHAEFAQKSGESATPELVPIEGLIAQAVPGRATAGARDALVARAARLRARAAAMRGGAVQSAATRARLAAAIAAYPTKFTGEN